jgi:hypothetical protein
VFISERGKKLDREERIASGLLMHEPRERPGSYTVLVEAIGDELVHILERQRGKYDLPHDRVRFADRVQRQHEWMRRAHLIVTVRADQ